MAHRFDGSPYTQLSAPSRSDVQGVIKDVSETLPENQTKYALYEDLLQFGSWASKVRAVTASGNVTLADADPIYIEIDPNGADRDVSTPSKSADNHGYFLLHSGSANVITVKRSGGATIATLSAGQVVYIMPSEAEDFNALSGDRSYSSWTQLNATLTFSSADDPIYVISSNADLSNDLQVGDKIRFVNNSTTFYGIINALGSWSGSAQLITVYGGTDYDVANSAITAPHYSKEKSPQGFPTSPAKWTVTAVSDANDKYKSSPTQNTLYGGANAYTAGSNISFSVPIGAWIPKFKCSLGIQKTTARAGVKVAISTGNNSISDVSLTASSSGYDNLTVPVYKEFDVLSAASKTTYYILITTPDASVSTIALWGSTFSPTVMTLVSAYL